LPALLGRNPQNTEDLWHYFYRGAYWRRGPVTMAAVSAIDVALWDIKGKSLGTPVYNLLGGKSRQDVLVYGHANGPGLSEASDRAGYLIEQGFRAVRVQAGVPGLAHSYGVAKGDQPYEPAQPGIAEEHLWDTAKYLRFTPELFERVRADHGDDVHLLHDVHHRLTPIEAARLAKDLEPYRLFWLEDPVAGELQEGLELIRKHSTTPIAIGEVFNTGFDYTTLINRQLIDYIRMPVSHGGGLSHLLKVAGWASFFHVQTGFHGATDLSPVALAAALHFDLAINNFGIQEYMPHPPVTSEVFSVPYTFSDGALTLSDTPGLGVGFDEQTAARFPYAPASLPVNRKLDGTLFHW
jgi:mannonate dehydratase